MKYWVLCIAVLLAFPAMAQQRPAGGAPSELSEVVKELREQIKDLEAEIADAEKNDPEEAAELKKQLAMLKSNLARLEQANSAFQGGGHAMTMERYDYVFSVPRFDNKRAATVTPGIKNNSQLTAHITSTGPVIEKIVPPAKRALAQELFHALQQHRPDSFTSADMAVGAWIAGDPYMALYLQYLSVRQDPLGVNGLNNYAVMLTMTGAEEYALPILQRLNYSIPNNSITLNNIGQAWYGLGDLQKAEKYLDSSMMFIGNHSQAKMTKCLIEEKKGNKQGAAELAKASLEEGYSEDKENHLERMGFKKDGSYIKGTDDIKEEYLGLQRFINMIPAYPKSAGALLEADREWTAFRDKLDAMLEKLEKEIEDYEPIQKKSVEQFTKGELNRTMFFSPIAKKYIAKNMDRLIIPTMEEVTRKPMQIVDEFRSDFAQVDALRERLNERLKGNLSAGEQCKAISDFLHYANEVRENFNNATIRFWKRSINTMAQYHRYYITPTPETYHLTILRLEETFLSELRGLQYESGASSWNTADCNAPPKTDSKKGPLPYFEDVHCDKHSVFKLPGLGTITTNCHYMETNFDPYNPLPLNLKYKLKDDLLTGQNVGGSVTVEYTQGVGEIPVGPIKLGAKAGVGATVEWDSNGISDVKLEEAGKIEFDVNAENSGIKSATVVELKNTVSMLSGPAVTLKTMASK